MGIMGLYATVSEQMVKKRVYLHLGEKKEKKNKQKSTESINIRAI